MGRYTDTYIIDLIIRNVHAKVRRFILTRPFDSLQDIICSADISDSIEAIEIKKTDDTVDFSVQVDQRSKTASKHSSTVDSAYSEESPSLSISSQQNQYTHWQNMCSRSEYSGIGSQTYESRKICFKCKNKGHVAKHCQQ